MAGQEWSDRWTTEIVGNELTMLGSRAQSEVAMSNNNPN